MEFENNANKVLLVIYVAICLALVFLIVLVSSKHDRAVEAAAINYEQCIHYVYHSTPEDMYAQLGVYPECPALSARD